MDNDSLKGKNLLVVDDEADLREIISMEVEYFGANVLQADSVSKALEILQNNHIDLIVSDIRMPGSTGVDLLKKVRQNNVSFPAIILITGFADIDTSEALSLGAEALIHKPFDIEELLNTVKHLINSFPQRYSRQSSVEGSLNFYYERDFAEEMNNNIFFGRGGVKIIHKDQPIPMGHHRKIQLHFKDQTLTFDGVVRWKKLQDDGASLGVEFTSLDQQMVAILSSFQDQAAYIPN